MITVIRRKCFGGNHMLVTMDNVAYQPLGQNEIND